MTTMPTRRLGGLQVSAIGLGEMPMSLAGRPDEDRSIRTVHAALDAGVTLIDTADAYAHDEAEFGHNEELVARALRSYGGSPDVLVALARKPRQVFTRELLLEQVWGYRHAADTRLVNVHVQRLRAKVERDPEKPEVVLTVRGVGYKAGPP